MRDVRRNRVFNRIIMKKTKEEITKVLDELKEATLSLYELQNKEEKIQIQVQAAQARATMAREELRGLIYS